MRLEDWQANLAEHFRELKAQRDVDNLGWPVFGLEHGLTPQDILDIKASLRVHICSQRPSLEHALVWVVYSSELGYQYAGDEYWPTFERETPEWVKYNDRNFIRSCFEEFRNEFGGASPSGDWARHFSIICWPITHAVLPRDLQQQLVETLYKLRHHLSGMLLESPKEFGELIKSRSWNATKRFQNFAQEPELLGQISTALLLHGEPDVENLIHPRTLQRIGDDLIRRQRERKWLESAQKSARNSRRVQGLKAPKSVRGLEDISCPSDAREVTAKLGIEPRLLLRPANQADCEWEILLEIPNLSHLLSSFPRIQDILSGSRCTVAGSSGRPLARGRFLHGTQRITLLDWPDARDVLLRFEKSDAQLDYLLRTECLLRPGSRYLFRVASDGLAYECRSLRVRPEQKYVLISTDGVFPANERLNSSSFSCMGIHGVFLDLPEALDEDWEQVLEELGLEQARLLEVWPVGLAAMKWDGDGYGEWPVNEQPCVAVRSDHPVESILISVEGDNTLSFELPLENLGKPEFIQLPKFYVGRHAIHVSVRDRERGVEHIGDLIVHICEPQIPQGPVLVQIDPEVPTLEQLWEGQAEISVQGPNSGVLECRISLFGRDGEEPIFDETLPAMRMPFTADVWRENFESNFRESQGAQRKYDDARVCRVEFDAAEFGVFEMRFEREFTPLRWILRGSKRLLRLLDDSGDSREIMVTRTTFEAPCSGKALDAENLNYQVDRQGALYVARKGEWRSSIIVPPIQQNLFGLVIIPDIEPRDRSLEAVCDMVFWAGRWSQAKLSGGLWSTRRQKQVVDVLVWEVFRIICGDKWGEAEKKIALSEDIGTIDHLAAEVQRDLGTLSENDFLLIDDESLLSETCESRVKRLIRYAEACRERVPTQAPRNGISAEAWIAEFALRLASAPAGVEAWAGQCLSSGLKALMDVPFWAKAARFLVIATDHCLKQHQSGPVAPYEGWRWP